MRRHKVSALESLQFSATSVVENVETCVTLDAKAPGDRVYLLGVTADELGASEYYAHFGYIGKNVPRVHPDRFLPVYQALHQAIGQGLVASAHGVYRGGLGVHLSMTAMAGSLGMRIRLDRAPADAPLRFDTLLFSESSGRLIVTVAPQHAAAFESLFENLPAAMIGEVTNTGRLEILDAADTARVNLSVADLKTAWKKTFGDLI